MRVAVLLALFVAGCGSSPTAPTPNTPPPVTVPAPDAPATPVRFFGVVTNEDNVPVPFAMVGVTYVPDSGQAQTLSAQTGFDGRYELQLSARQPGNLNALIRASATDYLPNEQLVRIADAAGRNFRLRRPRTIRVGQSTQVTFDADSSLCMTPGLSGICELVRIEFPGEWVRRLVVKSTPEADGVVPMLLANYGFPNIRGEEAISLPVGDDEFWDPRVPRFVDVAISIPAAATTDRYEVILYSAP